MTISRRWFWIIISASICAIVLGIGIYGYFKYDWFKSPKQIYLETEARALTKTFTTFDSNYKQLNSREQIGQSVHSRVNLTADLSSDVPMPDPQSEVLFELFNHTVINADLYKDSTSKKFSYDITAKPSGLNSIQLQAFSNGNTSGSRIPQFYDKFLLTSSDKTLQNELNNIPTKIITEQDLFNAISVSPDEASTLLKDYEEIFVQNLNKDQVNMRDGIFSAKTTEIKGKEFVVVFTPNQFDALQNKFFEKLRNDQQMIDFTYMRYMKVFELYQNSGLNSKLIDKANFQKNYQSKVDELQNILLRDKPDSGVKMIIRTDKQGNILEREISSLVPGQLYFRYAHWDEVSGLKNLLVSYKYNKESRSTEFDGAYSTRTDNQKKTGNIIIRGVLNSPEHNTDIYIFNSDYTLANSENKDSNTVHVSYEQGTNAIRSKYYINFNDQNIQQDNNSKATRDTSISFTVQQPKQIDYGPILTLHIIQENEIGVKVNIPQLNRDNSVDISELPKDELNNLNNVIKQNVQKWLINSPLFHR